MTYISPLILLAMATDAEKKSYPKDPDPRHWKTIKHSHVHIDKHGHIDGGAGGKFHGKPWTSTKHPHISEGYAKDPAPEPPKAPEPPPKTAEDLRTAWKAVAKERMEIKRSRTEKSKKAHEDKLEKAYKAYTDMRAEIEARDPAEAAKFRPTTGGAAGSKKTIAGDPLGALAATTAPSSAVPATALPPTTSATGDPPEVEAKATEFASAGGRAVYYFKAYEDGGDIEDLKKAKEELEKADAARAGMPTDDSEAFRAARKGVIAVCKSLGLPGAKLKDVFKRIKTEPLPATAEPSAPESPLASLASTTDPKAVGLSGATKEDIAKTRAKIPTLTKYDAHRAKSESREYADLGFTPKEREEFEQGLRRIFAASSYGMTMKTSVLALVLDSKFKSQYETGTSGGAKGDFAIMGRADIFGKLLGTGKTGRDDFPKKVREKYGAMVSSDLSKVDGTADWYGEGGSMGRKGCLIRFKKDRLAGKVTYTWGDSLDYYRRRASSKTAAGDADFPSLAGFGDGAPGGTCSKETLLKAAKKAKDIGEFRKMIGMTSRFCDDKYMELQYHGDLGIADIETIQFKDIPPNAKLVAKCKAKGLKCVDSKGKEL